MLNEKMQNALNDQLQAEYESAYLYLSMVAYFEDIELTGFAHWMMCQYKEETLHSLKFFDYINERNGRVTLNQISKPQFEWKSAKDALEHTLKHEQHVTSLINNLANLALEEKDHATLNYLQWFISEQVEEESTVNTILGKLKMVEGSKDAFYLLDQELSQRIPIDINNLTPQ